MRRPTLDQYRKFRAEQRLAVHRIVACVRSGIIPLSDWGRATILHARHAHSESMQRHVTADKVKAHLPKIDAIFVGGTEE